MLFIYFTIAALVCSKETRADLFADMVGRTASGEECINLGAKIPSNKDLRYKLASAEEHSNRLSAHRPEQVSLAELHLEEVSSTTCPDPKNRFQSGWLPVRLASSCPMAKARYRVNLNVSSAVPLYPRSLQNVECCHNYTECYVAEDIRGSCTKLEEEKIILRKTNKCVQSIDGKYYWKYRPISIKLTTACVCARQIGDPPAISSYPASVESNHSS